MGKHRSIKSNTGQGSNEKASWRLPIDKIQTITTLSIEVSKDYRVAIAQALTYSLKNTPEVSEIQNH